MNKSIFPNQEEESLASSITYLKSILFPCSSGCFGKQSHKDKK